MREILFRGKTEDGKWVEGVFIPDCLESLHNQQVDWGFIKRHWLTGEFDNVQFETVEVARETVGQFTGLLDKNGMKIFEGDILEITERGMTMRGGIVRFSYDYAGGWVICDPQKETSHCTLSLRKDVAVIGNIHDNPELVEVAR